jgi:hypothetical protein
MNGHGGARKGAGRKNSLTIFEQWEASNLCDLFERRQLTKLAYRATYSKKRLTEIRKAQNALRELPVEFRRSERAADLIEDAQAAFEDVGPASDDVLTAANYSPAKIYPRGFEIRNRGGRRPKGVAARERVIEIVARYLRRKWRRDVSPSSVRRAWKASRKLWRETDTLDTGSQT